MATYAQSITKQNTIRVTSPYGYRTDPVTGQTGTLHGGIDTVHTDHLAYAPTGGTVVAINYDANGWGNYIVVKVDSSYWLAGHFDSISLSVGQEIEKGTYIGVQGQTGKATGIHTHWEFWSGGYGTNYRVNPSGLIGLPNVIGTYQVIWNASEQGGGGDEPPTPVRRKSRKMPIWMMIRRF